MPPKGKKSAQNKENTSAPSSVPAVKPKNAVWSRTDDATLVNVLLEQAEEGQHSEAGFKSGAWVAAAEALVGSEVLSGGGPKHASSCYSHWQSKVSVIAVISLYSAHDKSSSAQEGLYRGPKIAEQVWLWLGRCEADGHRIRRSMGGFDPGQSILYVLLHDSHLNRQINP